MSAPPENAETRIGTRWPELIAAVFLMLLAGLVIVDSLRVGIGWADDGPRSGYFPFYIGLLLMGASAWTLGATLWRWHQAAPEFASRAQLAQVVSVFVPMVVYVALIFPLGIYLASTVLIAYFMRRYGKIRRRAHGLGVSGCAAAVLRGIRALVSGAFAQRSDRAVAWPVNACLRP